MLIPNPIKIIIQTRLKKSLIPFHKLKQKGKNLTQSHKRQKNKKQLQDLKEPITNIYLHITQKIIFIYFNSTQLELLLQSSLGQTHYSY